MTMEREEAIKTLQHCGTENYCRHYIETGNCYGCNRREALNMAIEALKNEPILCEDCRHRNTWDNGRLVPQYYRCGRGIKFRDYGYVREDDYCPLGERREE